MSPIESPSPLVEPTSHEWEWEPASIEITIESLTHAHLLRADIECSIGDLEWRDEIDDLRSRCDFFEATWASHEHLRAHKIETLDRTISLYLDARCYRQIDHSWLITPRYEILTVTWGPRHPHDLDRRHTKKSREIQSLRRS